MQKDVMITISGLQNYEDQEPDNVELITDGRFYRKNGDYYLTYKESELTGMGSTTTLLKIEENRVTIMRHGDTHSHMVFEPGQKHLSYYDTGFGSLTVGISTHRINKRVDDRGGNVEIDYSMEINHAMTGENSFSVKFRETDSH